MLGAIALVASLALSATSVVASPYPIRRQFKCGSDHPPAGLVSQVSRIQAVGYNGDTSRLESEGLVIDTYFHVVNRAANNGTGNSTFGPTEQQLKDQFDVLNKGYAPMDVSFNLVETTTTVNAEWATGADDLGMKKALRKGSYNDLNIYFLSDLGDGLLGFCYFPANVTEGSDEFSLDGCVVLSGSMPGGDAEPFNLGGTATHEVGHWFGLFHVFQGQSCTAGGQGDFIADTPIQSTPTSGCPASKDSCPNAPGTDSINNYMDYSDDICYTEFTAGQKTRIYELWDAYRANK